jgi:hypothetical protein
MVLGWDIESEELCISIPTSLRFSPLLFFT